MTLTMIHANVASLKNGVFTVDRKFHSGMLRYVESIDAQIATVHPAATEGIAIMDPIQVPCESLPYRVLTLETDIHGNPLAHERAALRDQVAGSRLIYGGGMGSVEVANRLGIPYILVMEYDLSTQICVTTSQTSSRLRKAIRTARTAIRYIGSISQMRRAHSLHCNGYPIYDATSGHNSARVLYLDSRMSRDSVIDLDALQRRLASRKGRPLKMLYSGRYEPMKGVEDAVAAGVECLRRGLDVELHLYGQGSLRGQLERIASTAPEPGKIHINDAIPYPDLVRLSQEFDLFLCCHIQNDPSCTYIESFGAGLPIVGYANRMWRRLCDESGAGRHAPIGDIRKLVDEIEDLSKKPDVLRDMSLKARNFAVAHDFDSEFRKRTDAVNAALAGARDKAA